MEKFIEWISNPFNQALFSIASSAVLGFFFMIIPIFLIKKQKPKFIVKTKTIISNYKSEYENLEVKFHKKTISNMTETRVYFWNAGNKSIRDTDLLRATPLKLYISEEIEVYRIDYIATVDVNNTIQITASDDGCYELSFDAMQKNDGICFRILHSGEEKSDISIIGKLDDSIKIKEGITLFDPDSISFLTLFNNNIGKVFIPMILSLISASVGIYSLLNKASLEKIFSYVGGMTYGRDMFSVNFSLCIVFLILSLYSLFKLQTTMPNTLLILSKRNNEYTKLFLRENKRGLKASDIITSQETSEVKP